MKKLFFFAIAGIILSACSNSGNKTQTGDQTKPNDVVITNDMENAMGKIPSWYNENTVIEMKEPLAHSGGFACVTNDTIQYSYTYREILKNINSAVPKIVIYSGWIYTTVANPQPSVAVVCSINDNGQQYIWKSNPLDNDLKETGKWVEFSARFIFDDKTLKPEQEFGVFIWNQSKKTIYIDDLKITFAY